MAQKGSKINWVIHADGVSKHEEEFFLSKFGELNEDRLHTPNVENQIHYALVSISYYEHGEEEGSSITIRKRITVCVSYPFPLLFLFINIILANPFFNS